MSQVDVLLTVGKLDASLALLTTEDHHVIEFPTVLLPDDVKAGSIVKLSVSQTLEEERKQRDLFREIQAKILEKYGTHKPKPPVLKIVNVTQTSCVLAWDPLELGSSSLKSLVLYRQGVRSTVIPCPLKANTTKISGLSVDTDYEFELKLTTTSGQLWSEKVKMHTHKMTDMSGITVCLGPLDPLLNISGAQIAQSLAQIGARPLQRRVAIDTTHFVTNDAENDDDAELIKAKNSNIPIVRPEWVRASEMERRIIGVRGFYLDADQGILKSYQFPPASDEFKAKFAKLRAGETTDSINLTKKLPEINGSQPAVNENGDGTENVQTTESDIKEAAELPADEAREEIVLQDSEGEKTHSKEMTDSEAQQAAESDQVGLGNSMSESQLAEQTPTPEVQDTTTEEPQENKNLAEDVQATESELPIVDEPTTEKPEDVLATGSDAREPETKASEAAEELNLPAESEQPAVHDDAVDQEEPSSQAAEELNLPAESEQPAVHDEAVGQEEPSSEAAEELNLPAESEQPAVHNDSVDQEEPSSEAVEELNLPAESEQPAVKGLSNDEDAGQSVEQPEKPPLNEQTATSEEPAEKESAGGAVSGKDSSEISETEQPADVNNPLEPSAEQTTESASEPANEAAGEPASEPASEPAAEPSAPRSNKKNKKKKNKKK